MFSYSIVRRDADGIGGDHGIGIGGNGRDADRIGIGIGIGGNSPEGC